VVRWKYLSLVVAFFVAAAGLLAVAFTPSTAPAATATLVTQRLDIDPAALPRLAQAAFSDGRVAQAVAQQFPAYAWDPSDVVPKRVSLEVEPDTMVLKVVGHDRNREMAATLVYVAVGPFLAELAATGVGQFTLQAMPDPSDTSVGPDPDALPIKGPASVTAAVLMGVGVGLLLGRSLHSHQVAA
jgi:hypothetical protein